MGKIVLTLLRPLVVTRLILRTHQAVGTAATVGHQVQVTAAPPDRLLHMTAPDFRGLKSRECFKSGDGNSYGFDLQGVISIYIHV